MCARKKLIRFEEIHHSPFVVEFDRDEVKETMTSWIGKKPIILELACGRGEYTIALAKQYPDHICIGVDVQGERLWYGLQEKQEYTLDNVYFARVHIEQLVEYLPAGVVDQIWITFPDPFPREGQAKKRLVSPRFLTMYKTLLAPGGTVHLKTDNYGLYHYGEDMVAQFGATIHHCIDDIDLVDFPPSLQSLLDVKTVYEEKHRALGSRIHYLSWSY